ncbi:MAG: DMT family transporter [bacterium]|nr:DMT family transporter [bacterium]
MKTGTVKSNSMLLLAAAIWGFAFVAQRIGMDFMGPFAFNAIRFTMGALVLLPFMLRRHRRVRLGSDPENGRAPTLIAGLKRALPGGLLAGLILFGGSSCQQMGIVYTSAGKAGFITGLYVIIVPLLGLIWRQRAGRGTWLGAILATVGLYLLSVPETGGISFGDLLVLAGAFFWAGHVQLIDHLSDRIAPLHLAFIQFVTNSLLSLIASLLFETTTMAAISGAALPLLYSGFLSVGCAYTMQVIAQRDAHPAHAAIILSLESVFALIGGWVVLSERLGLRGLTGCALMFGGMLLSQLVKGRNASPDANSPVSGEQP